MIWCSESCIQHVSSDVLAFIYYIHFWRKKITRSLFDNYDTFVLSVQVLHYINIHQFYQSITLKYQGHNSEHCTNTSTFSKVQHTSNQNYFYMAAIDEEIKWSFRKYVVRLPIPFGNKETRKPCCFVLGGNFVVLLLCG